MTRFHQSRSLPDSFRAALAGIRIALGSERNLKIHLALSLLALIAAGLTPLSRLEWVLVLGCIGWMWTVELLNSAIEYAVDWVGQGEWRSEAGQVKDIAAGACLVSAIACALIGALVFLPHWLPA